MMKTITISYLDNYLYYCADGGVGSEPHGDGGVVCDDERLDDCFALLCGGHDVWVRGSHGIRHLHDYLRARYRMVKAAGGVVEAPDGELLAIFREGRWDLPKGMVERGETLAQAALREVAEETGIQHATLGNLILKTYHIYDKYGGWHLKQTSWFSMHTTDKQTAVPQTEEGITQAVWLPREECLQRLEQSFASLRLVAAEVRSKSYEL
jgi:8-oxo-dGTP pyrophosphatase MutT (NUDIX family)